MNNLNPTADSPNRALMTRADCPTWCAGHQAADPSQAHDISSSTDGSTIVVHRGRLIPPTLGTTSMSMLREVQWDTEGTLIDRTDTVLLGETLLHSPAEITALAEALDDLAIDMTIERRAGSALGLNTRDERRRESAEVSAEQVRRLHSQLLATGPSASITLEPGHPLHREHEGAWWRDTGDLAIPAVFGTDLEGMPASFADYYDLDGKRIVVADQPKGWLQEHLTAAGLGSAAWYEPNVVRPLGDEGVVIGRGHWIATRTEERAGRLWVQFLTPAEARRMNNAEVSE